MRPASAQAWIPPTASGSVGQSRWPALSNNATAAALSAFARRSFGSQAMHTEPADHDDGMVAKPWRHMQSCAGYRNRLQSGIDHTLGLPPMMHLRISDIA